MKIKNQNVLLLYILLLLSYSVAESQVGATISASGSGADPHPSAILELIANDKGLLIPRMSTTERDNNLTPIPPANGLIIYNSTINLFEYWNGTNWVSISPAENSFSGNPLANQMAFWLNSSTLTHSDNIYVNNSNTFFGIGTNSPAFTIDAKGTINSGGNGINGEIRIVESVSNFATSLLTSSTISASQSFTLPGEYGSSGQVIAGDGNGNLYWVNAGEDINAADPVSSIQYNAAGSFGGNANFVFDENNVRVGIGTNSPSATLDVNGVVNLGSSTFRSAVILNDGNSNNLTIRPSENTISGTTFTLPPDEGEALQYLQSLGNGSLSWSTAPSVTATNYHWSATDNSNGPNITNSLATVDFNEQVLNSDNSVFSFSTLNNQLTINSTRKFQFNIVVSFQTSATHVAGLVTLYRNSVAVNGFTGYNATGNNNPSFLSISLNGIVDVNAGDVFEVRAQRVAGGGNLTTIAYASNWTVSSLAGGQVGPQGPQGEAGPPGTASDYFDIWDATGNVIINPGPETLVFDQIRNISNSGMFALDGSGIITVNVSDYMMFIYRVGIDGNSGTSRSQHFTFLETRETELDAWTEVPGFRGHEYNRQADRGYSTSTMQGIIQTVNGQQFRVRVQRQSGTDQLRTMPAGSGLTIYNIRGGEQGPPGPVAGSDRNLIYNESGEAGASDRLIWDYTNSRLGIDNSNPTAKLDVSGIIKSGSSTFEGQFDLFSPTSNFTTSLLSSTTSTSNLQFILPSSYGLNNQVLATSGGGELFWTNQSSGGGGGDPAGNSGNIQFNNSSSFAGTDNLFWDIGNSRLGINTNTPFYALDVNGNIRSGSTGNQGGLYLHSGNGGNQLFLRANLSMSGDYTYIFPEDDGTNNQFLRTDGSGNLTWATVSGGGGGNWERTGNNTYLENNGDNVGVGTSSPSYKLDVLGGIRSGGDGQRGYISLFSEQGATDYELVLTPNSGMISSNTYTFPSGYGTNNFVLTTDGSGNLSWTDKGVVGSSGWALSGNSIAGTDFLGSTNFQPLQLRVNNNQVLRFNTNGSIQADNGGDARGQNSIDLQRVRANANQVASGNYSAIVTGQNNRVNSQFSFIGSGNTQLASAQYSFIGSGANNIASGNSSVIGGGNDNTASGANSVIGGGGSNNVSQQYSVIVGGQNNSISSQGFQFIGGGASNVASNQHAVIVGGSGNTNSGQRSFIGGGENNLVDNQSSVVVGGVDNEGTNQLVFVGGGSGNIASGRVSTIVGGEDNTTSNQWAFIGGGSGNTASGMRSAILGGQDNTASNQHAFVVGSNSTASQQRTVAIGSYVEMSNQGAVGIGDASTNTLTSNSNNRFFARFVNGYRLYTNSGLSTGAQMNAGESSWSSISDSNKKENFFFPDELEYLEKLSRLRVSTWNYKEVEDISKRNYGPMAQDFFFLFGNDPYGTIGTDSTIKAYDLASLSIIGVKGLLKKYNLLFDIFSKQNDKINNLEEEVILLKRKIEEIQKSNNEIIERIRKLEININKY